MKSRKWMWIGLMSVAYPAGAWAQIPGVPAAPAVPGAAAAVAPTTAQPTTLWSFLGISKPQIQACIQAKCQTPCGQFLSQATAPLTMFSGGIIPPLCSGLPTPQDLADKGAVGAAAAIKADAAGAKARRAAMRYLGTVDCSRYPDAQGALIAGLRGDTIECVRYEAALALGNGCCCTKATMEALSISASCSDRDGKPREYSNRVRAAAVAALQHCLSCYVDPNPPKQEKIIEGKIQENKKPPQTPEEIHKPQNAHDDGGDADKPSAKEKPPRPVGMDYYACIANVPTKLIVDEARKVVEKYNQGTVVQSVLKRQNSVVSIINQTLGDGPANNSSLMVMENGVPVGRAEMVSSRPQNLWEMLTRQTDPAPAANSMRSEAVVQSTTEPPSFSVKSEPMPMPMPPKLEAPPMPMPRSDRYVASPPRTTDSASPRILSPLPPPVAVKPMSPSDVLYNGPYGEIHMNRLKTPAELASQPHGSGMNIVASPTKPATLPAELAKDSTMPSERQSFKPVVPPKANEPTPLAQRALTIMIEPHPPAVREQIVGSLTIADVQSCPEVIPVLVEAARSGSDEVTRKAAIRALVRCQANSPAVMAALEKLRDDPTPSIRADAAIGVAKLRVMK